MPILIFAKILQILKVRENYKGKLGGQALKWPLFGLRCTDFAQICFKSHVGTKYEKSRTFEVPYLFEKK